MANTWNQFIYLDEEAENDASMSNTVPIASGGGIQQMNENASAAREERVWTPQELQLPEYMPWPDSVAKEDIVAIIVGQEQMKFEVHESKLDCSEYFRTALNDRWKEGEERVITLDDVEPNVFKLFANFIYTGKISGGFSSERDLEAYKEPWLRACIKAYALGARILAPDFCNNVIGVFVLRLDGKFPVATGYRPVVQLAFSTLSPGCVILQILVNTYCATSHEGHNSESDIASDMPEDFRRRVIYRWNELRNSGMT